MNGSLILVSFWLACFVAVAAAQPKHLSQYPNHLTRDGHLLILPARGTLYIVSDLHAHWDDFNAWLEQTQLLARIEAGEDVYGLILGDAIDYKPEEPRQPPYGDTLIIERVMEIRQHLGERGERLIYLRGNHEFAAADTYAKLKRHGMTAQNRARLIRSLYNGPSGAYYQQFNFIERMTDAHYAFLMSLPTVVIGKNGCVAVHAGPARRLTGLADLVAPGPKTLEELLWHRPNVALSGGYTVAHTANFLRTLRAQLLVVGHTPIRYFPPQNVRDGIATFGENQLIFSTGYGGLPGVPTYIEIDLAETYPSVHALKLGVNIHHLYPEGHRNRKEEAR